MTNPLVIRPALRRKAKLRLGMAAPAGAGKTLSSLLIAKGIGGKIGLIDTENGSGDLYANQIDGGYDVISLSAPYTPQRYCEAIHAFEAAGYTTIIIDSLTHAWSGEGGSLDKQGKLADKTGNSYTAWRSVTPDHNALVNAMLQSSCHIIATMRAKTEYVLQADKNGKQVPKKVGMAPVMRDGIEYEFTVFFELSIDHIASASKDRTGLFEGLFFTPAEDTGRELLAWLEDGAAALPTWSQERAAWSKALLASVDLPTLKATWEQADRKARENGDAAARATFVDNKETRKAELTPPSSDIGRATIPPLHSANDRPPVDDHLPLSEMPHVPAYEQE